MILLHLTLYLVVIVFQLIQVQNELLEKMIALKNAIKNDKSKNSNQIL